MNEPIQNGVSQSGVSDQFMPFTYGELAQVYRRGQGAYLSSGSRNVSMAAWAMGRVNSYMSGKGGARKADADIYKKARGKK